MTTILLLDDNKQTSISWRLPNKKRLLLLLLLLLLWMQRLRWWCHS